MEEQLEQVFGEFHPDAFVRQTKRFRGEWLDAFNTYALRQQLRAKLLQTANKKLDSINHVKILRMVAVIPTRDKQLRCIKKKFAGFVRSYEEVEELIEHPNYDRALFRGEISGDPVEGYEKAIREAMKPFANNYQYRDILTFFHDNMKESSEEESSEEDSSEDEESDEEGVNYNF